MSAIIKALKKALDADPTNWETRHALVESYLKEGQKDEAFALLSEIQVLPEDEGSLISAAMSYALAGSREDGLGIIQSVLEANPANADAHIALASIAHLDGDTKTAMRHFVTATSLNPEVSAPELESAYGSLLDSIGLRKEKPAVPAPVVQGSPPPPPPSQPVPVTESAPVSSVEPEVIEEPKVELEVEVAPFQAGEAFESAPVPKPAVEKFESVPLPKPPVDLPEEPVAQTEVEEEAVVTPVEIAEEPAKAPKPKAILPQITQPLQNVPKKAETTDSGAISIRKMTPKDSAAPSDASPKTPTEAPAIAVSAADSAEDDSDLADLEEGAEGEFHELDEIRARQEELDDKRRRAMARDKLASLTVTILLHAGIVALLALVVVAVPRDVPPQIIASAVQADTPDDIQTETMRKTSVKPTSASSPTSDLITAANMSSIAISGVESVGSGVSPTLGMDFAPSMSFGDVSMSSESKMMFGQKMDGKVLGVILDVSGSMAEYLPMVIKEVDKNFKNAPIVYVNHAGMLGTGKDTEIYPIIPEEVLPSWPKEWNKGITSPFWFLWGDLPRKADQRHVDRLIDTFKTRPNMFIARGGRNRVGAAADFLATQKIDSLYIFSDFEDFVDEVYCTELGQKLGRAKVKTYVQPAAARSEYLAIMARRVAGRSMGGEMPPLTDLLRPGDLEPAPIAVAVKKELPVPEGVQFATPRPERPVDPTLGYNYNRWWDDNYKERFKNEVKVVEYPNFDIVINGPEARVLIYMKGKDGYFQSPIVFGYYSHKPFFEESSGKTYYPRRKWLRNEEEPKFDGNEFTWKMILEDEISFEVICWFKEDTVTATYKAQIPPNGESDGAFIFFSVPPIALERKDLYYSPDFPGGLDLDNLRMAMAHNTATFYLPVQAEDRLGTSWKQLGFKKGENVCPYNVLYRNLPDGVREVTIGGRSFGERRLQARTTSNNLLLTTGAYRADMEMWEGFQCRLVRPRDRRERTVKTEAIAFGID